MSSKCKIKDIALDGVIRQNPTLRLVLGTCPTLGLTTAASSSLSMGIAVTFVLILSNMIISLLRNIIPSKVRIPCFIVIIATFVTIVELFLNAFMPGLYGSLGLFLPLIVVNCLILGRAEGFASQNPVGHSFFDGLFMGIGFTLALVTMGAFREIIGAGTIFGNVLWDFKITFFAKPAGAFLTYGLFIALFNVVTTAVSNKLRHKHVEEVATTNEEVEA